MTLQVISVGVGRTGTYSLRLALNKLGFGPCFHMEDVIDAAPKQVPLWAAAADGQMDWEEIFGGFHSAVDWPGARFFKELHEAYPGAKFILSQRSPESWAKSFGSTIYQLLQMGDKLPPEMGPWLDMSNKVIAQTGFPPGLDEEGLKAGFIAHNEAVRAAIPAAQLLEYEVKEGWEPLCAYLGRPVPDEPFPRTNNRAEFWDLIASKS